MSEVHVIGMIFEGCISCDMVREIYEWLSKNCIGGKGIDADISIDEGVSILADMTPEELKAFDDMGYTRFISSIWDGEDAQSNYVVEYLR